MLLLGTKEDLLNKKYHFKPLIIFCLVPFILITIPVQRVEGANILFFYGVATHSHRTAIEPLAHKLVERGHNVTFLGPVKAHKNNSKFSEFAPVALVELYETGLKGLGDTGFPDRLQSKYANFMTKLETLVGFVDFSCNVLFKSPDVKPWIEKSHFDLIVVGHAANKCAYGIAHKYNASVILSSANSFFGSEEDGFGFPLESSWVPRFHLENHFTDELELSFYDKVYNTINPLVFHFYLKWWVFPRIDQLTRDFLELPQMPYLEELERLHTSLFFINQHFSEDYARSLPPMVVPVGGMHCTADKKDLPKDMEDFIQGAEDAGFIFVSFGSLVAMSKVPSHIHTIFFDAIKDSKTRFLWKWDGEPPKSLPKNVYTSKWFPQQDLLAHPKIKGFISHGGLMSLQQAMFHAVPVIVIPIVFDQPYNARRVVHHGIGIHLELSELTTDNFRVAVHRIISDTQIRSQMKVVSEHFRDRPMSPVDTAVYWTEYVLRHKNTSDMKPLGIHQSWWERRLLDVWAFLFSVLLVSVYVTYRMVKLILKFLFRLFAVSTINKLKVN